jgi:hypothetical protein
MTNPEAQQYLVFPTPGFAADPKITLFTPVSTGFQVRVSDVM